MKESQFWTAKNKSSKFFITFTKQVGEWGEGFPLLSNGAARHQTDQTLFARQYLRSGKRHWKIYRVRAMCYCVSVKLYSIFELQRKLSATLFFTTLNLRSSTHIMFHCSLLILCYIYIKKSIFCCELVIFGSELTRFTWIRNYKILSTC